ncbi:MAG: HmuY family protein [Balneolales bacterium]
MHNRTILLTAVVLFFFTACSDSVSSSDEEESDIEVQTVEDLEALGENEFTLFSLRTGEVIPQSDSASVNWDIGFAGTDIIINSGVHGPGNAEALMLDLAFEEVEIAPSEGYTIDTEEENAITGSGGWYTYTMFENPQHAVLAKEDVTIVLKTSDENHYAKLNIINYYKGNPDYDTDEFADSETRPDERYYTFQYAIQTTEDLRELK